ncbi:MAG: 50S ribosomal protein L29 [Euryarchaeota archaeon]|nr:50S ribosomal protein L29 [Euryarchaeota archaeon]
MAILRKGKIREMSPEEIDEKIKELRTDLARIRASIAAGGPPENPGRIRALRKTIARLLTIKKEIQKPKE